MHDDDDDDDERGEFQRFLEAYPAAKRKGGEKVRTAFTRALKHVAFIVLLNALTQHKRSVQWQNPRFIPAILIWLEEERWMQVLPEPEAPCTPWQMARKLGLK